MRNKASESPPDPGRFKQPNCPQRVGGMRGQLAGWVLGLALLVVPGSAMGAGAVTVATPASVSLIAPNDVASPTSSAAPTPRASSASQVSSPVVTPASSATYTVASGDCLSSIALRLYGDEGAWSEIWAANANRMMVDGMRFGDPNLIYVGWVLILPGLPAASSTPAKPSGSTATPLPTSPRATDSPTAGQAPRPSTRPEEDGQRSPSGLETPKSSGLGRSQGTPARVTDPGPAPSRHGLTGVRAPGEIGALLGASRGTEASTSPVVGDPVGGALQRWVPESTSLGLSALVAAAYLRRIQRRRAQARAARGDDEALADSDPTAVVFEARLAPFADAPVLEWLELANRHLTGSLRVEDRADPVPPIKVVRVGPDGVEMFLDQAVDWAPGSFRLADDGKSWRLPSEADRTRLWSDACGELAWLPLLVPVGDDASGTYLLHLEAGDVVSLDGPDAPAMLAAWVEAAKSWPWAEQVGVARDAKAAEAMAPFFVGQGSFEERATVLFTGELRTLANGRARPSPRSPPARVRP
jgi:LysM repeat protein